jgi:hypothetical protein
MNLVSLMDFPIYVRSTFGTDHLLSPSGVVCLPKEFNVRSSIRHPRLPFLIMDTGLQWLEGLPPKDPTKLYVVDPRALPYCGGREDVVSPGLTSDLGARFSEDGLTIVTRFISSPRLDPVRK